MADAFLGHPFRRLLWSPHWPAVAASSAAPLDWLETSSSHILKVNVPGFGKDEIKVQLEEGNVLHIAGEAKREEEKPKEAVWHVMERGEKEGFERRVALPENVRADHIKAHVENGVLTVVVPKEPAPVKPKPRAIPVSSKL